MVQAVVWRRGSRGRARRGHSAPKPALRSPLDAAALLEPLERVAEALIVDAEGRSKRGAGERLASGSEALEDQLVEFGPVALQHRGEHAQAGRLSE